MTPLAIDPVANILAGSNCCVLCSLLASFIAFLRGRHASGSVQGARGCLTRSAAIPRPSDGRNGGHDATSRMAGG